jgi:hypothetical protein
MRSAWLLAAGVACGGGAREQARREAQDFLCKSRIASYTASHHMGGDEIGVQMDCAEAGPRVKRWRTDREGKREEDQHPITPGEFDTVWNQIQGAGWENMGDCTNGTAGKQDPIYTFDIKDDQNQKTFQCQSQAMPYPYNTIVDPLDAVAQKGRAQLGDDEPADLKALDKKKPK